MTGSLSLESLLDYIDDETNKWKAWFTAHPETLEAKLDIAKTSDVRGLLTHIFSVEMRYGERLLAEPLTPFDQFQTTSLPEIFAIGDKGRAKLRQFLGHATDSELDHIMTIHSASLGEYNTSIRKVITHALLHGIRHWAQLATALRQQGFKTEWPHDFLLTSVIP
jgi:uncharacterized damage-inducible protein DinB